MRFRTLGSVVLAALLVNCGDSPTEVVPERSSPEAPPVSFATTTTEDGLSISTDKDDYQPGDTVHLTGGGWPANDVLDIQLDDEPATHPPHNWAIDVAEDGTFHDSTYVVDVGDLGVTFTLTATSRSTGRSLTVIFTDGDVRARTSSPSITITVAWRQFNANTTCTGTPSATGSVPGVSNSNTTIRNIVSGQSLEMTAPAAVSGQNFVNWTSGGTTLTTTTICVPGATPAQNWLATYAAPTNQAPTADAGGPYTGNEGQEITLDGSSSADTDGSIAAYSWTYEVVSADPGAGCTLTGANTVSPKITCNDDGSYKVKVTVTDDDGATDDDEATLTLANVAPTATFNAPTSVNEGDAINLSLTSPQDVSNDVAAGFAYAFDCGPGYGPFSSTSTASCPTTDGPENRTVKGKVKDKDDGVTEYTASVTVNNVKPTITSVTPNPSGQLVLGSNNQVSTTVTVAFTDPAGTSDEPYTTSINCGNGTSTSGSPTTYGSSSGNCTYTAADVGFRTISATVTDQDGATSDAVTVQVQVIYNWTGFFQPVENNDALNTAKAGSAIPIKFNLGGNQGLAIFNPNPPKSTQVACTGYADEDLIQDTFTAGQSSLTYDETAQQYVYVWKSDKNWAGTCRRLDVKLIDGTTHSAYFRWFR
jgi:hypothetical protein